MKNAILTGFALLMLVYTGWRSFDYIGGSLAGIDQTTRFIVSVAFLAFSEIGLLLWLHIGRPQATTDVQEVAATVMIWVDFLGIMLLGLGDLLRHNTMYAVDLSYLDPILLLAPWILVAANLAAYLVYKMADSAEQLAREERSLSHAETRLEMAARRGAVQELRANQDAISKDLAPYYYEEIKGRVTGRTINRKRKPAPAAVAVNGNDRTFDQETTAPVEPANPTSARKAKSSKG